MIDDFRLKIVDCRSVVSGQLSVVSCQWDYEEWFLCPARAQDSSRGQRPRKASGSLADPERVALRQAAGRESGRTPSGIRPFQGQVQVGHVFRGRCPPLLNRSPLGIKPAHGD